jgi:non-specific serine/threonine protein kinase
VTSREGAGLDSEERFSLAPLPVPPGDEINPVALMGFDSVALFVKRAQAFVTDFDLGQHGSYVRDICRLLDGLPLAIELTAGRVDSLSLESIAEQLNKRLSLLGSTGRALDARHNGLDAALGASYRVMSEPGQRLFRRLAIFRTSLGMGAVRRVGRGVAEEGPLFELVSDLVRRSMVQFSPSSEEGRYRLLAPLRRYGIEKLHEQGEIEEVEALHRSYFFEVAREAWSQLHGPDVGKWLRRLGDQFEDIRAAIFSALSSGDHQAAIDATNSLTWFWVAVRPGEALHLLDRVATEATEQAPGSGCLTHTALSQLRRVGGDAQGARQEARRAVDLGEISGDPGPLSMALGLLGTVLRSSDQPAANRFLERSVVVARQTETSWIKARALYCLAAAQLEWGQTNRALDNLAESLALSRTEDDLSAVGLCLWTIGDVARARGDARSAEAMAFQSLAIARRVEDREGIALSLLQLGEVAYARRQLELARRYLLETINICRRYLMKNIAGRALRYLAAVEIDSNASERGVTILAASSKLPGLTSEGPSEVERADARDIFEAARSQLDENVVFKRLCSGFHHGLRRAYRVRTLR